MSEKEDMERINLFMEKIKLALDHKPQNTSTEIMQHMYDEGEAILAMGVLPPELQLILDRANLRIYALLEKRKGGY